LLKGIEANIFHDRNVYVFLSSVADDLQAEQGSSGIIALLLLKQTI